jgi:hypothetical protein
MLLKQQGEQEELKKQEEQEELKNENNKKNKKDIIKYFLNYIIKKI